MSAFARRLMWATPQVSGGVGVVTHGQDMNNSNTGRIGAANASVANYAGTMTTLSGARTYSTSQTIRNVNFTGQVDVLAGNVTFEFCKFAFVPTASADTGPGYYQVLVDGGVATFNWCDFDTGYRSAGNNGTHACTDSFTANERTHSAVNTSRFTLYRCHFQGTNNMVCAQNYQSVDPGSFVTECYFNNLVAPDPSNPNGHPDCIEIRSSDNITIERCYLDCTVDATAHINRVMDWGFDNRKPTIIKDNYFAGIAASPIIVQSNGGSGPVYNAYITGNRFTDAQYAGSSNGHILLASSQDATYNLATAQNIANQPVIYWGHSGADSNVWAPDGIDVTPGQTPGSLVGSEDFFRNGSPDTWNGTLLP